MDLDFPLVGVHVFNEGRPFQVEIEALVLFTSFIALQTEAAFK
jgi:hypothetical protein